MNRATSFFLDVLRLVAALTVFLAHTAVYWNPELSWAAQVWAHNAVIVFFVLSGYVIAYTTREGARDARQYTVARLSRLYSVVAPALLLTAVLWIVGRELDPELYRNYERVYPWIRFGASAVYLNEVWAFELSPPTNTPFWSLGYEAWYYLFFGLVVFIRSRLWRWLTVLVAALVVGPKVLLLVPVWLVGVAAYQYRTWGHLTPRQAVMALVVATGFTSWVLLSLPKWPGLHGFHPWYFSGSAISDFIAGLGWGCVIWSFNLAFQHVRVGDGFYRTVRWMAGHTFSLYLYHAPLVVFATAIAPPMMMPGQEWVPLVAILAIVVVLGAITEGQRKHWQRLFAWGWDMLFDRTTGRRHALPRHEV